MRDSTRPSWSDLDRRVAPVEVLGPQWDEIVTESERRVRENEDFDRWVWLGDDESATFAKRVETMIVGVAGEFLFEATTGKAPDIRGGPDGGVDFPWEGGTSIDVKSVHYWNRPVLMKKIGTRWVATHYVLARVDIEKKLGQIVGWATNIEVRTAPVLKEYARFAPATCIEGPLTRPWVAGHLPSPRDEFVPLMEGGGWEIYLRENPDLSIAIDEPNQEEER